MLGSDGFGFARTPEGTHLKIPQVGGVTIEDDVEIGANAAIDRPAVGETRIGAGSKIDNLVQVAHGVTIGRNVLLAAQVGIAGSTTIEDGVTLAGQVGVAGHITMGKGTIATAQTGVPNSVEPGSFISGYPAINNRDWLRASAVFRRLPQLRKAVADLEARLAELEQQRERRSAARSSCAPGNRGTFKKFHQVLEVQRDGDGADVPLRARRPRVRSRAAGRRAAHSLQLDHTTMLIPWRAPRIER